MTRPHVPTWLSEFAGTMNLLVAARLVARWLDGPHSALATTVPAAPDRPAITGAVVGLLIISPFGRGSGGHFNPAVTVTFWLLRASRGATRSPTSSPG
jgi:glycerol uptake facilitator-like aquaporin